MSYFSNLPILFSQPASGATSYVNSVQQVSLTMGSGVATPATATISTVSSKAFVIYQGQSISGSTQYTQFGRIDLTNSTTVTLRRGSNPSATTIVNAAVIDPTSNLVDTVQQGTITLAGASATATITGVDLTRSAVFFLGASTSTTGLGIPAFIKVELTNTTTVTAACTAGQTSNCIVGYVVVQFKAAAITSVQRFSQSVGTGSGTSFTQTITSVNPANCLLAYGGNTFGSTGGAAALFNETLTNGTTVTATRGQGSSLTTQSILSYTIIEFASGIVASAQRGTLGVTGTSATATISTVNTSKTIVNYTGVTCTSSTLSDIYSAATLTNSTTITASRGSGTGTSTVGWEAITFN